MTSAVVGSMAAVHIAGRVVDPLASQAATVIGAGMTRAVLLVVVMLSLLLVLLVLTGRIVGPVARLADTDPTDHERSRRSEKGGKA